MEIKENVSQWHFYCLIALSLHYITDIHSSKEVIKEFILKLDSRPEYVFFDTETTGLDCFLDRVLLIQFKLSNDVYVFNRNTVGDEFFHKLFDRINSCGTVLVGHNIKFDVKMMAGDLGIKLSKVFDTMVAEKVITAGIGKKFVSLADLYIKYCGVNPDKSVRETFYNIDKSTTVFSQEQIEYSAEDVLYLDEVLKAQLENIRENGLTKIIEIEMDVVLAVCDMELTGVALDVDHHTRLTNSAIEKSKVLTEQLLDMILSRLEGRKYKNALEFATALRIPVSRKRDREALSGLTHVDTAVGWIKENFNKNSHPQMLAAFNLCGIKTDSTNEKVINKLPKDALIDKLLEIREVEKLISTYGFNLIDLIHPVTGKIHTDYFQVGTQTGRFSSSDPNMQNLPRKGGYREGFVASDGFSFISMDYSQQEYRLVGALSGEPKIIDAYVRGSDMHTATAAHRFGKSLEEVTSEERNYGKTMNFAILYGTTEYGLMRNFSISKQEALGMLNDFYEGYPVLTAFKNEVEDRILKLRYSVTPFGRRRYFNPAPIMGTPREIDRAESEVRREGFNVIIQGGGADVTKLAMLYVAKRNPFGLDKFRMLLQVHDELVCEVHDSILQEGEEFMRTCMLEAFQPLLKEIPAKVDSRISKRWGKG